jgi:signal transduction histidine kinase
MLQHSRGKAGEVQATDINAMLEEDINLAYHGMRAQDSSFNVKFETDFDPSVGKLMVVPQDISRVFLNLISNGCYEVHSRKMEQNGDFMPLLSVRTRNLGKKVEIRIRDNGKGIPLAIRDKLFTPFFTTKPTGKGTGLGLSISYDIIVQQHGGQLFFESEEGQFAEFIILLPK